MIRTRSTASIAARVYKVLGVRLSNQKNIHHISFHIFYLSFATLKDDDSNARDRVATLAVLLFRRCRADLISGIS